ncbi:MAG: hypothetical protein WAU96_09630 [Anaerolineae bacterium]
MNSCFASIEQLADPHLRGRPIAVAAYDSPRGCIVAPSIEAKKLGIKTGMQVQQGRQLCRDLIVLQPDPDKYRSVHVKLRKLLSEYSDALAAKSIDEFALNLEGCPALRQGMTAIAWEIKQRIKSEVGESLTVSIGIGPNRFLSKTAAGLRKPDGLDEINATNHADVFSRLKLMDLCGIKERNCIRLNRHGIYSVMDFMRADARILKAAFEGIVGYFWHARLHGWEVDDVNYDRHSYGNAFSLPEPKTSPEDLAPILVKLTERTAARMRRGGYACRGVHVAALYRDGDHWHRGMALGRDLSDTRAIYAQAFRLLCASPIHQPVATLAESVYDLREVKTQQLSLFEDVEREHRLVEVVDGINDKWGRGMLTPARMMAAKTLAPDRIGFGSVKELEEAVLAR